MYPKYLEDFMISLHKTTKRFGEKVAVNQLSAEIKEGEVVGFLGPNGAGKTTTMRLIVGYLSPTEGTIEVDGKNPQTDRLSILRQIGYLPENNPLYQDMKVEEYLQFIVDIKDRHGESLRTIIEETGIADVLQNKIEELSRGFKQRVGLTAALIGNPKIIILDEPTSGLDPIEQEKIRNLMKVLGKKRTIILSTHILSEAEEVATRLIILNRGRLVYDGVKPKGTGAVEKLFKKRVVNTPI